MGKQNKGAYADFVQPVTDPVKPTGFSAFIKAPLEREEGRALFAQTGAFKGDSDYDEGLVFGADQNRLRAENQPWYDELGNAAVKTVPGMALGIVENAGYIGELFSGDQDYTNALTEIAQKGRQGLEGAMPNYKKNPNEIIDFSDSAWWIDNGQGLVESIGEFLVTGAGVGSTLGKGSKLLANAVKGTKAYSAVARGGNVAATIGTSATLAYTEGAMSGAQVYKDVFASEMAIHGNSQQATQKASEAASTTVKLNTIINTGLNITSVVPLMKTFDNLYTTGRLGLSRKTGESLTAYGTRLGELEAMGIPQASIKKRLVFEAIQEGLEEDVNLFAESEGRIKGGIEKATSDNALTRFLNKAITEEGRLNFALGAIGGIGQTAGMDLAPVRSYIDAEGNTSRVSNRELNNIQQNEFAKGVIATLQEDVRYLTTKQQELNNAVTKGDKVAANKAKEDLFNIAALKSLREGYSEEFSSDLSKIASIDNTSIGEDGMTEAMRLGYANDPKDNDFKAKALKKTGDLKKLSSEYDGIQQLFPDKFVADQVFRTRMDVYSATENVEELQKQNNIITTELLKNTTDSTISSIVDMSANVSALNQLVAGLEKKPNKSKEDQAALRNLKASLLIEDKVLQDTLELSPSLKADLSKNMGVVKQLMLNRVPLIGYNEELKQIKAAYNDLIANSTNTTKQYLALKNEFTTRVEEAKQEEKKIVEKVKEKEDLAVAKVAKNNKYREVVGKFAIESSPNGFDVIDQDAQIAISGHTTVEEARAAAKEANKKVKKSIIEEPQGIPVSSDPVVITDKTTQTEGYQGKTKKEAEKENEFIEKTIASNTINEEKLGRHNKFAYRAKETDESTINPDYLVLHSKDFSVGTKLALYIALDSKFYKEGIENDRMPIGIYHEGKIVGYLALPKEGETELRAIRNKIISGPVVETVVSDKDFGVLNRSKTKHPVSEAMPIIKGIAIAKDNTLLTGVNKVYSGELSNNLTDSPVKDGITHAIITTPNGKDIAIPLDTIKVSPEVVESVTTAFRIYLSADELLPEDGKILEEIFSKYDIDLRTSKGFEKYFKTFFHNFVFSKADINELNADKNDKFWVEFDGENIKYLSSGRAVTDGKGQLQPKKVGLKTPKEIQEGFIDELSKHLGNMYYNVDLVSLQNNSSVSVPLLSFDSNQTLVYTEYSKPSYIEHIKSITETNIVGAKVSDTEYTYFVNPRLYFSTSFMGEESEKNYAQPMQKPEEKAILAPSKKTVRSMTKRLSSSLSDSKQVTKEVVEERKKACS